jgi:sec-independent protein translocase protein TatB
VFDVSFSELMVIAVVALLVIGPEKLPKVARTLGALVGRMQRYAAQVKEEVNREARFDDLQKIQEEIKQGWQQAEQDYKMQAAELEQQVMTEKVSKSKTTSPTKKAVVKKASTEKGSAKKAPAKKMPAKIATAEGVTAKKVPVKKMPVKIASTEDVIAKKAPAKKTPARKALNKVSA